MSEEKQQGFPTYHYDVSTPAKTAMFHIRTNDEKVMCSFLKVSHLDKYTVSESIKHVELVEVEVPEPKKVAIGITESEFEKGNKEFQEAVKIADNAEYNPDMSPVKCKFCKSDTWDNRENKLQPKSPDFKCKDKSCGAAAWVNKGKLSWKK